MTVEARAWGRAALASLAVAAGLAAAVAVSPAAADPVRVQSAARADLGRIVFAWPGPVSHTSSLADGRFTVRFGRPIEASYAGIARTLGKYVETVAPGDDPNSVVITLKGDFDAYSFDSGRAVIVEIAERAGAPAEEAGPAETEDSAKTPDDEAPPAVRVRTGEHAEYTRIVFDWPARVPYTLNQQGGVATVTFGKAAPVDLGRLASRPPRYVGGARATLGDDSVMVTLSVPPTSTVRHFLSGPKVVVDVRRPTGSEKAGPLPPPEVATATKGEAEAKDAKDAKDAQETKDAQDAKGATATKAAKDAEKGEAAPEKTAQAATAETASRPAPPASATPTPIPAAAADTTGPPAAAKTPAAAAPATKASEAGTGAEAGPEAGQATAETAARAAKTAAAETTQPPPAATAPAAAGGPTRLTPRALTPTPLTPRLPAEATPSPALAPAPAAAPGAPPPLPPTPAEATARAPAEDVLTLRFDWDEPVGAAVFRRADFLWVAFDRPTAIDIEQLRKAGGNIIKGIEQMGTSAGTVLRMATVAGVNPSLRRDGLAWLLDFRKQTVETATPLTVNAQPDSPVGARLFVPVSEPGEPIGVTDPEVGDNIVIVPLIPLGHGIELEYVYPQARFLQTSQGVVVKPRADDIRVRPLRQGIEVTSGSVLYISEVTAEAEANRKLATQKPLTRIFNLERWKITDLELFLTKKHELLQAVARSKDAQREAARLDLARFYFANGFNAEALALLGNIQLDRSGIEAESEFRLLRGGARLMLGRIEEAGEDLTHPSVSDNDEANFWLAAARAAAGDAEGAADELRRTARIIRPYPRPLKAPLGTLVVKAAIDVGDVKQARHFLEIVGLEKLDHAEKSALDLQDGRLLELTGDFDAAIGKWEQVRDGHHRPSTVKATVARMELLMKLDRMTKRDAIKELEALRFAWRGDEFEFSLLRRLGGLYLEEGLYREGLDRLRQAATHYRTHPQAPEVTQQMADAFSKLFLDNAADALAPVTALAIYDEFKELTPAGVRGDEMIRKLADRLVGVDLLDRATALLSAQVRFRLQGAEKARVGAQLTLVHLLARDHQAALKVLNETEVPGIADPLLTQRRHLRAKSLLARGDREQSLAVLKGDKSADAELLRTETFWTARQWTDASQALRRLLRATNAKAGESLSDRQAAYVLNYAIALTLAGNERAVSRLNGDYGGAMEATELKDAFRLIASTPTLGLVDPGEVANEVKRVENFQSFMAAYRERLKKQNLSQLIAQPTTLLDTAGRKKPADGDTKAPDATAGDGQAPDAAAPPVPVGQPPAPAPRPQV